jgi:AmiR/NasT family two-component response regulator
LRDWFSQRELYERVSKKFKGKIKVDVVNNCKDAEKKFRSGKYDLIILDGDVQDGSTEKIFHIFKNKDNVLVRSSGYGFLEKASKAGFRNTFLKDLKEESIIKKITDLIK